MIGRRNIVVCVNKFSHPFIKSMNYFGTDVVCRIWCFALFTLELSKLFLVFLRFVVIFLWCTCQFHSR